MRHFLHLSSLPTRDNAYTWTKRATRKLACHKGMLNLRYFAHGIQFFNHLLAGGLNTRVYGQVLPLLLIDPVKADMKNSPATYLAVSESTLATKAVNEGRPSDPGAGWMTSAPMQQQVNTSLLIRDTQLTHHNCRIVWIGQNRDRRGIRDGIYSPQFNVNSWIWI